MKQYIYNMKPTLETSMTVLSPAQTCLRSSPNSENYGPQYCPQKKTGRKNLLNLQVRATAHTKTDRVPG